MPLRKNRRDTPELPGDAAELAGPVAVDGSFEVPGMDESSGVRRKPIVALMFAS
jgi:hypothetical protein